MSCVMPSLTATYFWVARNTGPGYYDECCMFMAYERSSKAFWLALPGNKQMNT